MRSPTTKQSPACRTTTTNDTQHHSSTPPTTFILMTCPLQIIANHALHPLDQVGIELEGNVVLIDEAHNLLPAIESIHSHVLTGAVLQRAHEQLLEYRTRYASRMNTQNVVYVDQILAVLSGFLS